MARAIWTGALSFGPVNGPVGLYSETDRSGHFNQSERGTSSRIRYRRTNEDTGEEVDYDDIVKGEEVGDGTYVIARTATYWRWRRCSWPTRSATPSRNPDAAAAPVLRQEGPGHGHLADRLNDGHVGSDQLPGHLPLPGQRTFRGQTTGGRGGLGASPRPRPMSSTSWTRGGPAWMP
jgi:hypothetical protein